MTLRQFISVFVNTPVLQTRQYVWFKAKLVFIRRLGFFFPSHFKNNITLLSWREFSKRNTFIREKEFIFINRSKTFNRNIEWEFLTYGKLWNYQLQSFEFLFQENFEKADGEKLINDFATYFRKHPAGFEPYPSSLRIVNWIKFFLIHQIKDAMLLQSLFLQTQKLSYSVERHLRNNHILENGFALLFAGVFFNDKKFFKKGKNIIENELKNQILPDGAHFELSAMYHQLMLHRILDCIQLLEKNKPEENFLIAKLLSAASLMLGWMNEMQFSNGDMPLMNDAANNVAPTSTELNEYATMLHIYPLKTTLKESGFRKIKTPFYECLLDVGGLEPLANAGHAHADSLHFILYVNGIPFIIDTGTSTYDKSERRFFERSTIAHNIVSVSGKNQSEIWDTFRIGRRAKITHLEEGSNFIEATVKFYDNSITHTRRFEFSENSFVITDNVLGDNLNKKYFLYVEKKYKLAHSKSKVHSNIATIEFKGEQNILIDETVAASEFNKQNTCNRITAQFENTLITTFTFHKF